MQVWRRFVSIAKPFWFSEQRKSARTLLGVLLLLMLAVNGLNIVINFVGGDFMTALSEKNAPKYWQLLMMYGSVFVVGTPIVVFYSWVQQKLGIKWREWLTGHFLGKYFQDRNFYKLSANCEIDNPDERIAQDIASFTSGALSVLLVILGSIITLVSFTGILWSISVPLVGVLLLYALAGTVATVWFGKRLVGLNFLRLKKEADFRYGLIHVRNNVESIAFYRGEEQEVFQIKRRFLDVVKNFNMLIGWQRNLGFLTTGYNYFVVIIPSLVIAPLYFAGKVKFGVITQADMAFTQVLAGLSLIVSQFESLSSFVAVINRLGSFEEALQQKERRATAIVTTDSTRVEFDRVTLQTPDGKHTLVKELNGVTASTGGLLVVGASGAGKSSLLRAISGLWNSGNGTIARPGLEKMLFLPQRPYMVLGGLRAQLVYPYERERYSEDEMRAALVKVNLADLPERISGFDTEIDWANFLSTGEQQRLAFARLVLHKPEVAVLDEATSALDVDNERILYQLLHGSGISYISVGHRMSLLDYHQQVLEFKGNAGWTFSLSRDYAHSKAAQHYMVPVPLPVVPAAV